MVQTYSSGEQLLHHALLDLAGLGEFFFQRGDLGVHVAQDGCDGGLFWLGTVELMISSII